jgi:PAS domain S-box-containing protein
MEDGPMTGPERHLNPVPQRKPSRRFAPAAGASEETIEQDRIARSILDSAHEAFVSMDATGKILDWNQQAETTFGWPREEAIGRALGDTIVPKEHREAHWRGLNHFVATGEGPLLNKRIDVTALHRDGHQLPVELTISPMRRNGSWVFNAFLHDISERKRAEESLALAHKIALAVGEAETTEQGLVVVLRSICEELDWDWGEAWIPTGDASRLERSHASFANAPRLERFGHDGTVSSLEPGQGVIRDVWSTRKAAWRVDVGSDPDFLRSALAREVGLAAALAVPVLADEEVVAVLLFLSSEQRQQDRAVINLVSAIAAQLGSTIRRRETEDVLKQRELQLAQAQRVAGIGSWEWDIRDDQVRWSDELYDIFALDRETFGASYESFLEAMAPEDRDRVDAAVRRSLANASPFDLTHSIVRPDQSVRVLRSQGEVLADEHGTPLKMIATAQDLTERKQAERKFEALLGTAPDAMVIVGPNGEISLVNRRTEELFGYDQAELVGESVEVLVPPRFRDRHPGHRDGFFSDPKVRPMGAGLDLYGLRKDGAEFPIEISLGPLQTEEGVLVSAAIRDITERKRAEEQIALAHELALEIGAAESIEAALELALNRICDRTGWAMGQVWVPSDDGAYLQCSPAWYSATPGLEAFRARSGSTTFAPGEGLPGRVWSSKQPTWVEDVTADLNFPRAPFAREVGLRAAVAVPVIAEQDVVAIMEFFLLDRRQEDNRLVDLVSTAAVQLGSLFNRKQAEEAHRKSEERFRLLLESVKDHAFFMLDSSGYVASWNQGAESITGYSAEEIMGYHLSRFYTAEDVEQGQPERDLELARSSGTHEEECWRVRKDGHRAWTSVAISALYTEDHELRGFSHVIRDISARRRAEEELGRLGAIVESSEDAIISTTPNGIITTWNSGAERLFGYSAREAIGRSAIMLVPTEKSAAAKQVVDHVLAVEQVLAGKKVDHYETVRLRKDGSLVDVSLTASPIKDTSGNTRGISFIARDITDRKRARQYLEKAFGTYLDRGVADRILKEGPALLGERVEVTMMFVDIRDFTSYAELFEPEEVVETLNCLFDLAVPIIMGHGGHVDKFVGDGLLAVFGTPRQQEDHADRAVQAALGIEQRASTEFEGDLEIGIGLASGVAVAGNVGGGGRLDFTVIGDAVNMAARVEAATRETGDTLLMTEETRRLLRKTELGLEQRSGISIKGKTEPVLLYAPIIDSANR